MTVINPTNVPNTYQILASSLWRSNRLRFGFFTAILRGVSNVLVTLGDRIVAPVTDDDAMGIFYSAVDSDTYLIQTKAYVNSMIHGKTFISQPFAPTDWRDWLTKRRECMDDILVDPGTFSDETYRKHVQKTHLMAKGLLTGYVEKNGEVLAICEKIAAMNAHR